jgi:hypothetical protein
VKCWTFWLLNVKDWKVVGPRLCLECEFFIMLCTKLLSTFSSSTLLKEEFWGLSFKEHRVYGMDIPRSLHFRVDMK